MELSIKPVSGRNRRQVLELSVAESQKGFVESPAECLLEAKRLWLWKPVAIYADDAVIGFAMYGRFPKEGEHGRVWLDRLLIDHTKQGKGYGTAAIRLLCEQIRKKYHCSEIYLSCYPQNTAAVGLYRKMGFAFNGEKDINGEDVMVLQKDG